MRPAYSVIFLTTLIGAGQGLLLALFAADAIRWPVAPTRTFIVAGAGLAILLAGLGLVASFFHLGRPERAWRTAAMWRTSWLSREVIALPLFIGLVGLYWLAVREEWPDRVVLDVDEGDAHPGSDAELVEQRRGVDPFHRRYRAMRCCWCTDRAPRRTTSVPGIR